MKACYSVRIPATARSPSNSNGEVRPQVTTGPNEHLAQLIFHKLVFNGKYSHNFNNLRENLCFKVLFLEVMSLGSSNFEELVQQLEICCGGQTSIREVQGSVFTAVNNC